MLHILSAADLPKNRIDQWFQSARTISKNPKHWTQSLRGCLAGTLFFEPSTRTRWSTEAAMLRLGGQVLSMESAKDSSSDKKGESLADTFTTCSQYVDCLIVRHPKEHSIQEAAPSSDVPVINGGDGANEHPTQALLDLYTILERFPDPTGKHIMFTGDLAFSRTIHSLVKLLEPYKMHVTIEGGQSLLVGKLDDGGKWTPYMGSVHSVYGDEPYGMLPKIDILYMTRHQANRRPQAQLVKNMTTDSLAEKSNFTLTNALACTMKRDAIIMHPLPRNSELPQEVDANPRAVYKQQVKNGMWVRMALLHDLLIGAAS